MSRYVLVLKNTHEKLKIKVNNKNYYIYADNQREIFHPPKDDFRIKEKLFILSYPLEVVWVPISDIAYDFLRAFYFFIKPRHLVIEPLNGKVIIRVVKSL